VFAEGGYAGEKNKAPGRENRDHRSRLGKDGSRDSLPRRVCPPHPNPLNASSLTAEPGQGQGVSDAGGKGPGLEVSEATGTGLGLEDAKRAEPGTVLVGQGLHPAPWRTTTEGAPQAVALIRESSPRIRFRRPRSFGWWRSVGTAAPSL
jgi:hypothetical protein